MAFIKRAVLRADSDLVEHPEGSEASRLPAQQEQASGSLSGVSASVSDLMAPGKRKTLLFEPSVVSQSTIDFYVSKGYFPEGVCRLPGPEVFRCLRLERWWFLRIFLPLGCAFRWIQ